MCKISVHTKKTDAKRPLTQGTCRDRAEERRKGFNPDYERVSADLASLVGGGRGIGIDGDPSDPNQLSMEEKSKYLGGDMDHTHLVKGLDYALLQKVSPLPLCTLLGTETCLSNVVAELQGHWNHVAPVGSRGALMCSRGCHSNPRLFWRQYDKSSTADHTQHHAHGD